MADFPGDIGTGQVKPGSDFLDWCWFSDSRLNYAEAILEAGSWSVPEAPQVAIICSNETGNRRELSLEELKTQVRSMAGFFRSQGIQPGDRIAAILPNIPEAVIAMLAAASIGAIWSCCSPEFGEDAIWDRFGQIDPKIVLACPQVTYNLKTWDCQEKISQLLNRFTTLQAVVWVGSGLREDNLGEREWNWEKAQSQSPALTSWERFPFDHPLCLLYSSGTTGKPKGILHGAGGTLLQHAKEHSLHSDVKPGDTVFYYTTTGWMMWNWLLGALGRGATIVLFDGSPLAQEWKTLWKLAQEEGVTHFGASPRYYATVEKEGGSPAEHFPLPRLKTIFSTGSPLPPDSFQWIYRHVKSDVNLASISGGTDILSCFVLGNPTLPVYAGQIQCKGLGMDVQIVDEGGQQLVGQPGELVCKTPFPSRPIRFWNDPENKRYRAAYFQKFPGVWCHGDWAMETDWGGMVIFGRSDATLNPSGVRIGTAEIYQQVESFPQIQESLAIPFKKDGDETILLFVRMRQGETLDSRIVDAIRTALRVRCSPRHVPSAVIEAPDFPRTISGKLSEIAVRNAVNGQSLGNEGALANPESLAFFRNQPWMGNQP